MTRHLVAEVTDCLGSHLVMCVHLDEVNLWGTAPPAVTIDMLGAFDTWDEAWRFFQRQKKRRPQPRGMAEATTA